MHSIGSIEKAMYRRRRECPIVIPQVDPSNLSITDIEHLFSQIETLGLEFVAIGGTIIKPQEIQQVVNLAIKSYKLKCLTYPSNSGVFLIDVPAHSCALYWMSIANAENTFFQRDMLIQNSLSLLSSKLECIPTVYVFDDRDSVEASHWLSRAIPVPRHKPYLSLSIALAAQLSGSRFYIMAGGSGCKLIPPIEHIKLIKDKTSLFLIPTSGIKSAEDANQIFTAGGDAIHVGKALESTSSDSLLSSLVSTSQKFPGQDFF